MNTSPTNLPLTSNGILGVVNLKHLSLDQLLQDDPQSKALKDVYIDSRIESETLCAALGLLDRAEENITRREPQVDTSQWNWGSLELIPKTNLLDRGVCKCLQLALSQDDDSPLASECLDYLESIVSAYHVYEDPDLSDETICRSILEESKIAIKENDSILRFLRNAVLKHTLSDSDLYKRVSDIALRLNEIKRRLSTLINQITTPKESEAHLKITPPKVATEAKEQTKLNAAHQRNCADMKTQLNRIKSALEVVDTNLLTGIIEKLKSAPLAAAEVVSLHQQITPYLDTIKNIKKLEPILNRFQPYASERKVELIGESKEADQLAELHFQLKKPMEDISSQISQLEPLLRFKTDNELVAIGAPALEAPASTPSLAFWGNYPEIDKLRTDTDFIQAIVGPNAPGFIQLMGLPELLIFAPDHLLLTDTRYRSPMLNQPQQYISIRIHAMMDAIRIVDPEAASTINNEFVEGYATAVQDFVNGKKTDIDTFRKKLLLTIFLSSKLKEMVRKQLNLYLDAAKEWIDAHPGTIPWPFNEPGSMIQVLTESLLPHLRGYFAKNKTTLKEDAAPISDFSDIGYFNLLRWLPVLIQNYRKNNNLTELQKVYFIMGMRPLDPDFPELENQAYAASKPLFEWSQAEPENTTHRKITTQMKTAINQAQILTTPSGSYILLGDNPALQDLRRFFSSEKVATYKGTSVQDDFLLSPIILTTQLGCRLKPINDLTDSEKTTLGWLAETLSSFQSLTTENNLSLTVAEHLIHRRETYHADVWKKLIAATRGPQENLHYRLSRAVAHYRI